MNIFFRLDDFLVGDIFQRIQNFVQRLTGKTCFFLTMVNFCMCIVVQFFIAVRFSLGGYFIDAFMQLWVVPLCAILALIAFARDKKYLYETSKMVANPDRVDVFWRLLRLMVLIMTALLLMPSIKGHISNAPRTLLQYMVFYSIAVYFQACTPLPPQKSWVKKVIEAIGRFFQPALRPAPAKE